MNRKEDDWRFSMMEIGKSNSLTTELIVHGTIDSTSVDSAGMEYIFPDIFIFHKSRRRKR